MNEMGCEGRDSLMTAEEAAQYLGLRISTVRRMTRMGELPVVRPTGRRAVRYRLSELEKLLRARSQPMRAQGQERPSGGVPGGRR